MSKTLWLSNASMWIKVNACLVSVWGQKRRLDHLPGASGLPRTTDIARPARLVRWCQSRAAKGSGLVSAEYGRYPSPRVMLSSTNLEILE